MATRSWSPVHHACWNSAALESITIYGRERQGTSSPNNVGQVVTVSASSQTATQADTCNVRCPFLAIIASSEHGAMSRRQIVVNRVATDCCVRHIRMEVAVVSAAPVTNWRVFTFPVTYKRSADLCHVSVVTPTMCMRAI